MYPNSVNFYFKASEIAFLTKHKKELIVAPILEPFLGTKIKAVSTYDTDLLGTFTREIKRVDTQLETARLKAQIAIEQSGLKYGIGSEGSFDLDPYMSIIPWNIEMLVFIDDIKKYEIIGMAEGPAKILNFTTNSFIELKEKALQIGFPEQHVILRAESENNDFIIKNITTFNELYRAYRKCVKKSSNGMVFIENDLRAYACPSRQEIIKLAAINLLMKMHSFCPSCNTPGFWVSDVEKGLPCEYCKLPTDVIKEQVYTCQKCGFKKLTERPDLKYAEQMYCNYCNP